MQSFPARSDAFVSTEPARHFIGGRFYDGGPERLPVYNPRHGKVIAEVHMGGYEDVDAAVAAAKKALPSWRERPIRERAHVFYKLRELMHRHYEELAWLVSHENGKIISEARAEVDKAIECIEFGCSLPNLAAGEVLEVSRGITGQVAYEALGIVAGVTPFNFPLMVPMWMLPQALIAGNAFILKPSEQVPLSSQRLAELFREAGLPDGIFNVVNGGRAVVEALCDHPGIAALGFVGSTTVAKLVYGRACSNGKRALCLGGAKNHLIVVPDADLNLTADNVVASFTGCAGQRCMAASVMVAVGDVDHVLDAVAKKAAKIQLGTDLGPVVSDVAEKKIRGYIDGAEAAGAKVLVDGRSKRGDEGGYWVGPTILDGVTPDMKVANEEIFGPVLSVVRVPTLEAAFELEARSPYGNAAAIYTTNGDVARALITRAEAGMVGVNVGVPVPREPFGFGGWNDSRFGHGTITGWDGFRFWTRERKITIKWATQKDTTWMG